MIFDKLRNLNRKWQELILSVIVDAIGIVSVFFGLTESLDIAWAPISALFVYSYLNQPAWAILNLFEELGVATDFIPTASIAWLFRWYIGIGPGELAKTVRAGKRKRKALKKGK